MSNYSENAQNIEDIAKKENEYPYIGKSHWKKSGRFLRYKLKFLTIYYKIKKNKWQAMKPEKAEIWIKN